MANLEEINDENFQSKVIESDKITLVDFWATWCGPCRKLAPVLEDIATEIADINIVKMDAEQNIETAKKYSISGLPSILIFKNGEAVERMVGLMPKSHIIKNIQKHLN